MNQILSTETYSEQKKNSGKELIDMKKIITIFSILAIAFAVIIAIAVGYGIIKKKRKNVELPIDNLNKPQITVEKIGNICVLKVLYDEGIQKVSYWWNSEDVTEINLNNLTTPFVKHLNIPDGINNMLFVKAVGSDNSVKEYNVKIEDGMTVAGEEDEKPEINWVYNTETKTIAITARSTNGLIDLSYQWEGEDVITKSSDRENQQEIQTEVEAKRGTNKIYITATDTKGNTQLKEDNIIGVLAPDIQMMIENTTGSSVLKIRVYHDMGFEKVTIDVNGQEFVYDKNRPDYSIELMEINIAKELERGHVNVLVKVNTREEPEKEYISQGQATID